MIQGAGVSDTQARLHQELFGAMLEEMMSGRLQAGALVEAESSVRSINLGKND